MRDLFQRERGGGVSAQEVDYRSVEKMQRERKIFHSEEVHGWLFRARGFEWVNSFDICEERCGGSVLEG